MNTFSTTFRDRSGRGEGKKTRLIQTDVLASKGVTLIKARSGKKGEKVVWIPDTRSLLTPNGEGKRKTTGKEKKLRSEANPSRTDKKFSRRLWGGV